MYEPSLIIHFPPSADGDLGDLGDLGDRRRIPGSGDYLVGASGPAGSGDWLLWCLGPQLWGFQLVVMGVSCWMLFLLGENPNGCWYGVPLVLGNCHMWLVCRISPDDRDVLGVRHNCLIKSKLNQPIADVFCASRLCTDSSAFKAMVCWSWPESTPYKFVCVS